MPINCIFNQEDLLDPVGARQTTGVTMDYSPGWEATEVVQREEAEMRLSSRDTSKARQKPAQAVTAEPLCHKSKITFQQYQGAETYHIHAEIHPAVLW